VLVHTLEAFEQLKAESLCPLAYAPLPFGKRPNRANFGPDAKDASAGEPFRLVVFGYLGRNRRLDALLRALAELEQQDQFQLDIYGQVLDEEKGLRAQIRALGLKRQVRIHGFVPEAELDQALALAHLAVNLRYPTMGEASGSQLRIWSHALPSLVTQVGWYAGLPEDAVAFVRPAQEVEDIKTHLRAFLASPARFAEMGQRGRRILEQEHNPDAYARAVLDLAAAALRFGPRAQSYGLAGRAAALASPWLESAAQEETFARVAAEIYALTEGGNKG
jgi:glycosyltransferase involved in cell wall biosynthesis